LQHEKEKKTNANDLVLQIMADRAMPLESADDVVSSTVPVDGAALGGNAC
jgi:hypothetical protein